MTRSIVMIHGMWCTGAAWDNYRPYFEERGFEVHVPTLRHHDAPGGATPDPALGTTSLLDYADDVEALIATIDAPPVIIGHSMGALVAQILCGRGLARAGLFLTPAAPAGIVALTPSVVRTFARILLTWGFWRKPTFPTEAEIAYAVHNRLDDAARKKEFATLVHDSGRATWEIAYWPLDRRHAATVAPIACPTLTIGATLDRITPASVVRRVGRRYGTYKEFPEHGHWVLGEPGWEGVAAYCHDWIEATLSAEDRQPATP